MEPEKGFHNLESYNLNSTMNLMTSKIKKGKKWNPLN